MIRSNRLKVAVRAGFFHLLASLSVALIAGAIVHLVWFPYPYYLLSGGQDLFLLLVGVDVVCGPLLTMVLFNPKKSRSELLRDMLMVVLIQLGALAYGVFVAYQARPLFLVHEMDRFRVIGLSDYLTEDDVSLLKTLPEKIRPSIVSGPIVVGIRNPINSKERQSVLLESIQGGRDYSQRPNFYVPYDDQYTPRVVGRSLPLEKFLAKYPSERKTAMELFDKNGVRMDDALFLPVVHRQDWVAILKKNGSIVGFLPGDGFGIGVEK